MVSRRVRHGIGWGMASTAVVAVIPLFSLAVGIWPTPAPVTPSLFGRVLGSSPTGFPAMVLAVLGQLIYGGFWGAFLAYVTEPFRPGEAPIVRPSMAAYGLGVGAFRFAVANLTALLYVGWGPFGVLVSPFIAVAILLSDVGFGLVLSWLVAREDAGLVPLRLPGAKSRVPSRGERAHST